MKMTLLLICLCAVLSACSRQPFENTPIKRLSTHSAIPLPALDARIGLQNSEVLDFYRQFDQQSNYQFYGLSADEFTQMTNALRSLPGKLYRLLEERCAGIYFIENLQGNGLSDLIWDNNGKPYVYLIFNPAAFHEKEASRLLTLKENTCFIQDDPRHFSVEWLSDRPFAPIRYILYHEAAHCADYLQGITPYVEPALKKYRKTSVTPFTRGIWAGYSQPAARHEFENRTNITFYGFSHGPKIRLSEAGALYSGLLKSDFASLYAAQNWAEDWAEAFSFTWAELHDNVRMELVFRGSKYEPLKYCPAENPHLRERTLQAMKLLGWY